MKKTLLFSFFIATTLAMSAKTIVFSHNGENIPADGTFVYSEYETYPMGKATEVFIDPEIYVTKDSSDPVSIRTTANYPIQLCIGGQCEANENILKENLTFNPNTPTSLLLDCSIIFNEGEALDIPEIDVLIEAWYSSTPDDVTKMKLLMGKVASSDDLTVNRNIISVNGRSFSYNLDSESSIEIFNLTGRCVASRKIQGTGSVAFDNLTKGVYIYRISGAMKSVGKFVVNK